MATLKALSTQGAEIANHNSIHNYMHNYMHLKQQGETDAQWQARTKNDILAAQKRIKEEIGHDYKYVAYPYGEFNNSLQALVKSIGLLVLVNTQVRWVFILTLPVYHASLHQAFTQNLIHYRQN